MTPELVVPFVPVLLRDEGASSRLQPEIGRILKHHGGNLRVTLFEIYDRYEQGTLAPSRSSNRSGGTGFG